MKIYLDVSCLNRPFDDQSQARVHLESEAVVLILDGVGAGRWEQVSSRIAEIEVLAIRDEVRRRRVLNLLPADIMQLSPLVFERARSIVGQNISAADALHLAAAEALKCDVFLTCDDRMLRRSLKLADQLYVRVANPVAWLQEQFNEP